jgi:hypothetical protein
LAAAAFKVTVQLSVPAFFIDPLVQVTPLSTGTPVPLKLTAVEVPLEELLVMVNVPLPAPADVGLNCTVNVAVWLGFNVSGKFAPETVKPDPVTEAAFTVTGALPVEDKVNEFVAGVFTFTFPKDTLEALMFSVGTVDPSCRENVCATLAALAVSVTVAAVVTELIVAVKFALVAPAATVTVAGTVTAALLLATLTANPPLVAAPLSVTVQLSVPVPDIEPLAQLSPLRTGMPAPLRFTTIEVPAEELLVNVSLPVAGPELTG